MRVFCSTASGNCDGRAAASSGVTSHGCLLIIDRARSLWFHDPRKSRKRLTGPSHLQRGGAHESGMDDDLEFPCHDIALVHLQLDLRLSVRRRTWIGVFHETGRGGFLAPQAAFASRAAAT